MNETFLNVAAKAIWITIGIAIIAIAIVVSMALLNAAAWLLTP